MAHHHLVMSQYLLDEALIKIASLFLDMQKTAQIYVSGYVQAVGYRIFAKRYADYFDITGFAQNLPDGRVKIVAYGSEGDLEKFITRLREGPRSAIVQDVQVNWSDESIASSKFTIK